MLAGWEGAVTMLVVQGNVQVMGVAGLRLVVICSWCLSEGPLGSLGAMDLFSSQED